MVARPASEIDSRLLRHDLLAPLRAIDNLTDFLSEDLAQGKVDDAEEQLDRIRGAVSASRALIDGVTAFEEARIRQPVEATDIDRLTRNLVAEFELPEDVSIVVQVRNPPEGPRAYVERTALKRALRQLIHNAIVHRSHPRGSVLVSVMTRESDLIFSITDDGAGIRPEYSDVVFEPLRKIRHNDRHRGPGLGLSIAKRLAKTHGACVEITSSSPSGTEMQMKWPLAKPRRLTNL